MKEKKMNENRKFPLFSIFPNIFEFSKKKKIFFQITDISKSEYVHESIKEISLIRPGVSVLTPEETTASVIQQMNNPFMTNGTFGQPANKDKLDANFMALVHNDQPLCEVNIYHWFPYHLIISSEFPSRISSRRSRCRRSVFWTLANASRRL